MLIKIVIFLFNVILDAKYNKDKKKNRIDKFLGK